VVRNRVLPDKLVWMGYAKFAMLFVTANVIPPEHRVVMTVIPAVADKLVVTEFVFQKMKYVVHTAPEVMEKVMAHTVVLKIPNVAREVVFQRTNSVVRVVKILILTVAQQIRNVVVLIVLMNVKVMNVTDDR
jgi:hypothetical protein